MGSGNKINFALILVFLVVIICVSYSYNSAMTNTLSDALDNDRESLQVCNDEIIEKISKTKEPSEWEAIIKKYDDRLITIKDTSNELIVKNMDGDSAALDIRVQSAFEFQGAAYLLTSSVYLLRDHSINETDILKIVFIELAFVFAALCLMVFICYSIMIRPYRAFYQSVEEYEQTGKFKKRKFFGYIGKVYDKFSQMTDNLEKQQDNQQRIIASISHDIKTPLTSIMGYSEQLRKENISDERRRRYIDKLYNKSLEIRGLVDEFDEYLSYDMMKSLRTEKVTTQQLCALFAEDCKDELENIDVGFSVNNYAPDACVMLDVPKMRRVFGNIIGNSIKHFRAGEKIIRIDVTEKKDIVKISVSDNGCGVEADKREIIFEPLYTSDKGRKVAGLGLAICHEIVESHSGKIYAEESDMGGLEICIELTKINGR
ncbi:MAG: HAMP domain-containing histidine kinase [Ruminococcus sp.]|nr:HAMP domain-containing histidine kinase [Ruminococcus sp.]